MRYDRFEYGIHRHLVVAPVTRPAGHLRTPPPVYVWDARPLFWFALLGHMAIGIVSLSL